MAELLYILFVSLIHIMFQIGPQCMLGEGLQMGDKCSVKRSVIGRHCRIGSNVKVLNSSLHRTGLKYEKCFQERFITNAYFLLLKLLS